MKVTIVGSGAWGKAIYSVVNHNTDNVSVAGRGEEIQADVVILCVPTQSIRVVLPLITFRGKQIIINTAKGIERSTHLLPHQIIANELPNADYYTLIGPGYSHDVINKTPTLVNLGYSKGGQTKQLARLFQTDYFRVRPSESVEALELSAACKNIYAIGCGLATGLGYGTSTRAALISLAIEELQRLFSGQKLKTDASSVPGTIGDLILSCNSEESRNFTFGKLLATLTTDESLEKIGATVEGYHSLASVSYLKNKTRIALLFATFIKDVVTHNKPEDTKNRFEEFVRGI